eukprot:s1135_g5.t1
MAASSSAASELSGGLRIFSGENEDHREYRRWKLWLSNKLLTLDELPKEAYGSYIFTCLSGKALEAVEHLDVSEYQKAGGETVLWKLLDQRFPEKEKSDELAEVLGEIFTLRAREGESIRAWISRSTELFQKCERKTGVNFPAEARGWMTLKWSGLSEEQQAVVKGRSLGVLKLETISQAMRSVYPDFVVKRRTGAAIVEGDFPETTADETSDEVQGFEDIELFLTDFVATPHADDEAIEEGDVAEVLATTWKDKRAEIAKLQQQRRFADAKDVKRSFRVEIEEMKKRTKCNRCGRLGHWARECRQKRDAASTSTAAPTGSSSRPGKESGASMVAPVEGDNDEIHFIASVTNVSTSEDSASLNHDEILLVSSPGYGVLDSGCGKATIGEDTLSLFMQKWQQMGLTAPAERAVTNQFRFGNGQVETSHRLLDLPVGLHGRRGILQAAVVKGSAPLLVSRPALKRLGAQIDFHRDLLSLFQGQVQVPLEVNSAGQYMVDVMQFPDRAFGPKPEVPVQPNPESAPVGPHVIPKVVDKPISPSPIDEALATAKSIPVANSRKNGGISKKQVRKLKHQAQKGLKPIGQKYAGVEVFCPPRLVPEVEKLGLKGLSVDIKQGWDLTDSRTADWLVNELEQYPPELLLLCPPCTDAGGWFHYNKCFMTLQEILKRKLMFKKHKELCKRLIRNQLKTHGRLVFEHPAPSTIWHDPDYKAWCDELTSFVTDMCCFNLHVPETPTSCKKLIRKHTRLLVSHEDMKDELCRRCPGEMHADHKDHAVIAGSHPGIGSISRHAGRYTPEFVQALIRSVPAFRTHEVLCLEGPVHDVTHVHEVLVAEQENASDEEINTVLTRLHKNLGHPSQQEFLRVLRHGHASAKALELAAKLKCDFCESRKGPAVSMPASLSHVSVFGQKIGIDVKNLNGWKVNQKVKALNIVDYASNFQLMVPFFETETAGLLRQLLSDRWFAWAGNPNELVIDPARTNLGKALTEPCELEGTHVSVTAAGAHWQLGKVEVHGGIFSHMLDKVIDERSPTTKEQWLDCVRHCHVKNATIQTHGFSPSQVVFGKNPDLPGQLLDEPQKIVPCTAGLIEGSVEAAQATRFAAKKALLEMQDSKSMRRALAARPRATRSFRAGDIVAYWRDQKWSQGTLSRGGRWYGSAVVLGNVGKNVVIVHRSHVLRCAPEQLRMATHAERQLVETPETQLLGIKDMLEGGAFRSSQYVDLVPQAYPTLEPDVVQQALSQSPNVPSDSMVDPVVAQSEAPIGEASGTLSEPTEVSSPSTVMPSNPVPDASMIENTPPPMDEAQSSAPASSSGRNDPQVSATADSQYGPVRRRVPSKAGPMTFFRPASLKHDDFVEVMQDVLPQLVDQAVGGLKREAADESSGHVDKSARTEQLSVEVMPSQFLSAHDANELWNTLQSGAPHEVLIAQHIQKRMQKELHHSNNEPWLQAQIDAAKIQEWNTLTDKQAVRLLSPAESAWVRKHEHHRIMGSRFVLVKKAEEDIVENGIAPDPHDPTHWKVKARWCLQGHLDPDLSSKAQEGMLQSPTLSQMGRMVLFQLLSSHKWLMQLGDIKGAFLEAGPLDPRFRPLYARLPAGGLPGATDDQLVEVLGNVYGQNDAPSSWYKVFDDEVHKAGFSRSRFDSCLYYLRDSANRLVGILGSHVDDTVTGGKGPEYEKALAYLKHRFPYRKWRTAEGEFCGCHYRQDPQTMEIHMSQKTFAQGLRPAYMPASRRAKRTAPLDGKETSILRAINGSLNWLASQSRPDLSAQVSLSQQAMSKPTVHHLCEVNNVIKPAQQHADLSICFKPIPPERISLACHSDAAFANVGVYTQAGYVIGFTDKGLDESEQVAWTPAVWKSYRLPRAVGSTLSAEAQAMVSATGTIEWTSLLLAEALYGLFDVREFASKLHQIKSIVITDCKSLYDHLVSVSAPTAVEDRRTSIDVVILRQSLMRTRASIRWVPTNRMLADSLTKDAGDPTDLLRACIRESSYQISANVPLTPEERNVLEHLLRRAHLATPGDEKGCPSVISADSDWSVPCGTSMTDAAKRRFDVSPEREARQVKYTGYESTSCVPPPLAPRSLVGSTKRGQSIFLPEGIDDMPMWGRSILEFGKYEKRGWTYCEMAESTEKDIVSYVKWCKSQADSADGLLRDFAFYLMARDYRPDQQHLVIPGTNHVRKLR